MKVNTPRRGSVPLLSVRQTAQSQDSSFETIQSVAFRNGCYFSFQNHRAVGLSLSLGETGSVCFDAVDVPANSNTAESLHVKMRSQRPETRSGSDLNQSFSPTIDALKNRNAPSENVKCFSSCPGLRWSCFMSTVSKT